MGVKPGSACACGMPRNNRTTGPRGYVSSHMPQLWACMGEGCCLCACQVVGGMQPARPHACLQHAFDCATGTCTWQTNPCCAALLPGSFTELFCHQGTACGLQLARMSHTQTHHTQTHLTCNLHCASGANTCDSKAARQACCRGAAAYHEAVPNTKLTSGGFTTPSMYTYNPTHMHPD